MSSWQVLRGSRASRSAADLQHGAGGSELGCRAAAAPGGTGSSGLSGEKVSLQQLNGRLASYLQQVKHLEAANQRLEHQIQEELDRKCPHELRQLDGHLKTASLLQDQIGEGLSAQAQLKLQILEAELTAFDLSERCQKECTGRACLEAELSDLRLLGEVLKAHSLPELQSLLNEQMQEMAELQVRHQQDMQVPPAKVTVEMHTTESSDLIQQVEHLRRTSAALLDRNQRESWSQTQVCMPRSSQVTFDPSARSEADRAKLRREVDHLTAELTEHQTVVLVLQASGQEQTESFLQQLEVLRRTADGLCRELDSVLQAAAQQAADHWALLDIKNRLEAETQNCKKLLDGVDHEGASHVHVNSKPAAKSVCLTTSPPTFRSTFTVAAAQSGFVHHKRPALAPLAESCQRTGAPSEKMSKSIISAETVSRPSGPVEDEVHAEDHDVQSSLFAGAQISHEIPNERASVKASTTEMITALVPNSTDTIQTKPEALISKQAGSPSTGRGVDFRVETNKTILCAEADINQQPWFITHETTFDLCKPTSPEVQMRETLIFTHVEPPEGSFHEKKKNLRQIVSTEAETSPETIKDVDETANIIQRPSGSSGVYRSAVEGEVCSDGGLMEDTDEVIDGKSGKGIVEAESVLSLDQSLGLSKNKPNKLTEDKNTRYDNENASSAAPENNNKLYSKTASAENLKEEMDKAEVHDHKEVKINPVHSDDELLSTTTSETSTSLTDSGVSLRSSSFEEGSQMYLTPNDPDTCLIPTEVNNGDVDKKEEGEDTSPVVSLDKRLAHMSNIKLMKAAESWSSMAVYSPENKEKLRRKSGTTEVLRAEVDEMEVVNNANKAMMDPERSKEDRVDLAGEEASNMSTSLTDSGVGLSCSSYEEFLSPKEVHLSAGETKPPSCLSPDIRQSLVETEMSRLTDHVFSPVEVGDHITSPDLLLSPNDSDSCLSPNSEDQNEATSLSLTEANEHVRPVEKYVLSTKEAGQSVSFSTDRTWPEGRTMKVRVSEGGGDVCFRPSERYEGRRVSLNGTKLSSRPTSQRNGLQVSSSHEGLVFGDGRSIIADREEQVGFGGLYRKREARRSRGKCARAAADEERIESDMMGQRNSDWQVVNLTGNTEGPRFGRVSNSGDAQVAAAGMEGRVRSASGEWKVYGGSLGRSDGSLSADSKEYLPAATSLPRSPPGAGRLSSGEWKLYGWRPGCMSSDSEDSAAMQLATSPPGTPGAEGCGSGGSGEWRVYGESTGRMSRASSADRAGISQTISPPSSPPSSCSRLSSGSVVRRSSSVGSTSGRFTSTGGAKRKPVYSSASGRKSSVGSAGWGGGGRTASSPRALSPGGTIGVTGGSGGWLSSPKAAGSGSFHSAGSNDKLSSSPGSGRTNSTGGRVISSSDWPIRSAGRIKERMSVCKMAALSMSAAGRERSQERQTRSRQHQAAAPSCDLSCRGHKLRP